MAGWREYRRRFARARHQGDFGPRAQGGNLEFRPLPLIANPHLQTILGSYWTGRIPRYPTRRGHVALPDGDRLVYHDSQPPGWRPGQQVAVLIHGLGGSHQSGYLRRMAARLWEQGIRAIRLDLRGAGHGAALARRTYNAGCSADVRAVVEALHAQAPTSALVLVGFSLGGNVVLKLAGEAAADPLPGLERVAAVAPPIDLERCARLIMLPRNRLYERFFVQALLAQLREQQRLCPNWEPVSLPRRLSLWEFDDRYTAPRGGYASAADYYRRASSLPLVPRIRVPTLLLTARDDPFIAVESFESLPAHPAIRVEIAPHGGHLGFLGWDGSGGIRWAERRLVRWVAEGQ